MHGNPKIKKLRNPSKTNYSIVPKQKIGILIALRYACVHYGGLIYIKLDRMDKSMGNTYAKFKSETSTGKK